MAEWSYDAGTHPALVSGAAAVVLAGRGAAAHARSLAERMPERSGLDDLLDALLARGVERAPEFCVVRVEDGSLTALVRGRFEIAVDTGGRRSCRASGAGARTWRELVVPGARTVAIAADPADAIAGVAAGARHAEPSAALSVGRLVGRLSPVARRGAPGRLVLPDGRRIPVDGTIVLGRSPRSGLTTGDALPTLVTLRGSASDVSRSHVRVTVDGPTVRMEDLGSATGTVLTPPDGAARRLRPGEPAVVAPGAVAELGGARIRFEETP